MAKRFYTTSREAWDAMLVDIREATRSVYWEIYILLDDGESTRAFFDLLVEKAREGVRVRVVVDGFGSWQLRSIIQKRFAEAGAELLFFNRRWFFPRTHRKHLIIDERIGYLGGVNVSHLFRNWADLEVRITERGLVKNLLRSFARVYRASGGGDPEVLRFLRVPKSFARSIRKVKMKLLERWPIKGKSILREYYRNACERAKEQIIIVTPYFVPHRWLMRTLSRAVGRGVRVEVFLPERTDRVVPNFANYVFAGINAERGIFFFLLPFMLHAKAFLVDNKEGMVGSNNIDAQSFDYNIESSLVFERKDLVGDLREILGRWRTLARPYRSSSDGRLLHAVLRPVFLVLQKIL